MIPSRTVTFSKIPEAITVISSQKNIPVRGKSLGEAVKEDVKKNSKIRRPSFWSNSYAKTEASSSPAEDSQSDIDHSW